MRPYRIAQGSLLNDLWYLNVKEIQKKRVYMYMYGTVETQHCKASILQ